MHEYLLQGSHTEISFPRMRYMFAEGPPKSLMYPLKSGCLVIISASFKTDSAERLETNFPWCAEMVQKLHPPKHPR